MTNAEKYKEVFGIPVDMSMCPCDTCVYCGSPELLIEEHYLKEGSYCTSKIIQRCMANEYRYPINCVMAKTLCKYKEVVNNG